MHISYAGSSFVNKTIGLAMRIHLVAITLFSGLFLVQPISSYATSPVDSSFMLRVYEDSMKSLQYVRINARTDKEKDTANARLFILMKKALLLPGSFNYPFDSLATIGIVMSPDKQFRLITWDVPKEGCAFGYYGFVQAYNPAKKKYNLFVLEDHSADITTPKTGVFTPDKWLGMIYYKIIKQKDTKFYTLLAWQGYNKMITHKVIDVISFNSQGAPLFGKSVYKKLPASFRGNPKRVIFEYSAEVTMTLRYDESKDRILFDHLIPIDDGLKGQYQYYGPSFQIDAMEWKNGEWNYMADVDARNPKEKEDQLFNNPKHPTYQPDKKAIYTAPH